MGKQLPLPQPVKLKDHRNKWRNCEKCGLCEFASNHVFFRRLNRNQDDLAVDRWKKFKIPLFRCDVLFIGEAPGEIEDYNGRPFTGKSGKLLNQIAEEALGLAKLDLFVGFTNIVACYPPTTEIEKQQTGNTVRPPTAAEAKACQERLEECLVSVQPKLVVCVGSVAKALFPRKFVTAKKHFPFIQHIDHIIHPAAILRMLDTQAPTEKARVRMRLKSMFSMLK